MNFRFLSLLLIGLCLFFPNLSYGKEQVFLNGSIQHDGIFGINDASIESQYSDPYLSNTYIDIGLQSEHTRAGVRLEVMPKPIYEFSEDFGGAGIGNFYVGGKYKWFDITLGDVYAQYGSGLILRLWEDRALGIDNSLRGGKVILRPYKGIHLEAIGGKQRVYWNCYGSHWGWDYSKGAVLGANMELQIDDWCPKLVEKDIRLMVGASYVSKYDPMDTIYYSYHPARIYNLPQWTAAGDLRLKFNIKNWSVLAEYAYRANDPSADNTLSYKHGEALLLSAGYSTKGFSVLLQAKRSENMSFRSDRMLRAYDGMLNYLPAFTTNHTYALATIYPYATQMTGEWAWQGEIRYSWKKNTPMGGRYGTTLHLNGAHIRGIGDSWFKMGKETYYTDVHLELNKRVAKNWWLNAMYFYQHCNRFITEGHGETIHAHIVVADVKWKVSDNVNMRAELQYLHSNPVQTDFENQWIHGLYELSLWNCLTLSASDTYNIDGKNYWQAGATFQMKGHRIAAFFVKQRAGYNCAGGVCRFVRANKGATVNYSFNF